MNMTPVAVAVFAVATVTAGRLTAQRPPQGPPPGQLVNIGGHSLHIHCVGPGGAGPTVILEAGAGDYSAAWVRVQDLLSSRVRTCAYDRASWGWSEPGPGPRSMTQEAFELRTLLDSAGIPGPYVLVGHSYGALLVRRYIDKYGEEVRGVVLVSPTHEDSQQGVVGEGWVRLRERATGRPIPEPRRLRATDTLVAGYDAWRDLWPDEFQQLYLARAANAAPLGDRPLVSISSSRVEPPPPGTSDEFWRELGAEKTEHTLDLAQLSTSGNLVWDPSSGHRIHVDNPQIVVRAIDDVIGATRVRHGSRRSEPAYYASVIGLFAES